MYEYLLENLISYSQVDGNLRRTADRGLVSELYRKQMNALALKYFGVDSNGNYTENKEDIVAYRCPYSGEIISDLYTAHLEHILPVSSNGGTVLFNCIPILDRINLSKSDESNLLVWWQEQGYFNYDRLERLIQYMLEAYTIAFKQPTEEELYDYDNSLNNDDYIENDDLSIDLKDKISKKLNTNIQQNITYYQLISDLINELSKNRDVSKYNSQLNNLKKQNTFGNIEELEKVIKAVQTVFKETLGDNSKKYLSYSLKIDMTKLLNSLKTNDYENEIRKRLKLIEQLLANNKKQLEDFFESIQDIEDINILYNDSPSSEQITTFLNNIKLSHSSRIDIFIEMLSNPKYTSYKNGIPNENNIFSQKNKIYFFDSEVYINDFWSRYGEKEIKSSLNTKIFELENKSSLTELEQIKLNKLKKAKREIDKYEFSNKKNNMKRVDKFIEMLSNPKYTNYINGKPDSQSVFRGENIILFEGFEDIEGLNTSNFWNQNRLLIKTRLNKLIKKIEEKNSKEAIDVNNLNKLKKAKREIDKYEFSIYPKKRARVFIEMIANPENTAYLNGKPDKNNIFSEVNKKTFLGYEDIEGLYTRLFWSNNGNNIIKPLLNSMILELEVKNSLTEAEQIEYKKLKKAKREIDKYEFSLQSNLEKRTKVFIHMLSNQEYTKYVNGAPEKNNILGKLNEVPFLGYEDIDGLIVGQFWWNNSEFIKKYIETHYFELENKNSLTEAEQIEYNELKKAKREIDKYEFSLQSNIKKRAKVFIEMLCDFKNTQFVNNQPDDNNIFNQNNNVPYLGYEDIDGLEIGGFWNRNSKRYVIPLLFYNKDYNSKTNSYFESSNNYKDKTYDIARQRIMDYLNLQRRKKKQPEFKTIDEYIDTLDKTKKEVKSLIELRDSLLLRKEQLIVENQELTEELNSSYRRAM